MDLDMDNEDEFNMKFEEKKNTSNVKDIIETLKKTPISHTNFEGVFEKRDSQIDLVKSHIADKYDKIKIEMDKFNKYCVDDKSFAEWWKKELPRTPGPNHQFMAWIYLKDIIELQQLIVNLYESIDKSAKMALKDSKAIDLQRHLQTELNKLIEENNKFIKELMTTNNTQVQENTKHTVEVFSSKMALLIEKFDMLMRMQAERQQHFEEKIINVLVSKMLVSPKDSKTLLSEFGSSSVLEFEKPDIKSLPKHPPKSKPELPEIDELPIPLPPVEELKEEEFVCPEPGCGWKFVSPEKLKLHAMVVHKKKG